MTPAERFERFARACELAAALLRERPDAKAVRDRCDPHFYGNRSAVAAARGRGSRPPRRTA
jgi:hypothetical protein